jgi:Leucine-rich repeat (LRR) protein
MKKITLFFLSLIFLSVSLYAQREQDSLTLVKFFKATDGENWNHNTNWLSSEPISTWQGVTVSENRVQELVLINNNLNGTLPAEIGNLSALKTLIILDNPLLSGSLPTEIGNLTELTRLVLHENDFSGSIPTSIGNLTKLTELTLSGNQFSGSIPAEIGNLSLLDKLLLGENNLSGTIPSSLGNLNVLTRLDLNDNDFSGALFPEMINLTSLERIYLANNAFTSLVDFSSFTNLRYLGVDNNMLDFEDLELANINQDQTSISYDNQGVKLSISETINGTEHTLEALYTVSGINYQWKKDNVSMDAETEVTLIVPDANIGVYNYLVTHPNWPDLVLESESIIIGDLHGGVILSDSLALADLYNNLDGENWHNSYYDYNGSHNWLTSEPITHWAGVKIADGRVISLDMEDMVLVGVLPSTIGNFDSLNYLNLSSNNLSGSIPAEIGNLTNLTTLNLSSNSLSGVIPAEIGNLNKLTLLRLDNNQLSGALPAEIGTLNQLETIFLNKNLLTNLTNLSNLTNLTSLSVSDNQLDFETLEAAQIDWINNNFYYSPQNYGLPFSKQTVGSDITLTVDYAYAGTTYQWYKDKQILINETSKTLTFSSSDLGVYQCKAQHTNLPKLTLETEAYINGDLHGGVFLSDSLALVAFYNSSNGNNWKDNTNWLSSEPIEDWYGLSVENGRVVSLGLTDNNLTGTLASEIGTLNYLDKLILWDNKIGGEIPSEIGNLQSLTGLYLNGNNFTGSIPASFGNLKNVTDIWIHSNNLTGEIPSEIENILGLRRLYAYDNQLSGNIPSSFGQLKNLYVLLLSGNKLSGELPEEMKNMTALKYIEIENNEISGLCDLSVLPEISSLYVANNLLDFEDIENVHVDWSGYYFRYSPQKLILPIIQTNDGTDYTFEVDYSFAGVTYQWYKNDVLIDGETKQSISFPISELGHYYCKVNYASLPDLTLQSETIFISTVGIKKPGTFVSKVFPNPTRDFLKIQMEKPLNNNALLELKDICGNTVLSQNMGNKNEVELQLQCLSKGIYFLQINNGEDTFVQKIILN